MNLETTPARSILLAGNRAVRYLDPLEVGTGHLEYLVECAEAEIIEDRLTDEEAVSLEHWLEVAHESLADRTQTPFMVAR
jgi:hypothetical protein